MFRILRKLAKNNRGAALVEYGLLIAGVALICAAAVSVFGHKTSDLIGTVAAILPGAQTEDNQPMLSGRLIETTAGPSGVGVDFGTIAGSGRGTDRLGQNVGGAAATTAAGVDGLLVETAK